MGIEIRVYLPEVSDFDSLRAWLGDIPDITAESVPGASRPGEQGDVWEFLAVVCGTGGALTVGLNALTTWLESKVTHARVVIGDTEVELRGPDPEALEKLVKAAKDGT